MKKNNLIVTVNADKARNLKLTPFQVMLFEKEKQKNFLEYFQWLGQNISSINTEEIVRVLYMELKWEDKDITLENTYEIFGEIIENYNGYEKAIIEIFKPIALYYGMSTDAYEESIDNTKKEQMEKLKKTKKTT